MNKIALVLLISLFSFSGYSQLVEYFDDASVVAPVSGSDIWELPSGTWQIFDNEVGDVDWTINPDMTYPAASGQHAVFINRENIGDGNTSVDYFASPLISIPENPQLRFVTRSTSTVDYGTIFEVRAAPGSADPADISAYTTLISTWSETTLSTIYSEKTVDMPADIEGENSMYIAFVKIYTQDGDAIGGERWLVDNVRVIPKCPMPQNVVIMPLSDSFVVSWDQQMDVIEWQVGIFPTGSNIEQGEPLITSSTTNVVLTQTTTLIPVPLQPDTTYKVMIIGICEYGPSDQYESEFYLTQQMPPQCGELYVDSGGIDGNYSIQEDVITTICPDTPGDLITVTFTQFELEDGGFDRMYVHDGISTFAPIIASDNPIGLEGEGFATGAFWGSENPGNFEASSESGCLTFHFISNNNDGNLAGWQAEIDCIPIPDCRKPAHLALGIPTDTTVVLDWTPVGAVNQWKVYALPCGSPEPTFETPGSQEAATHPFEITGLAPDTCYDFYVISICSDTQGSAASRPRTKTTQVAPPKCGELFTDAGGPEGNYPAGSDSIVVICPETEADIVTVTFIDFGIQPTYAGLYIHDGDSVSAPLIPSANSDGAYWGFEIPGSFEASGASGCLTFHFISELFDTAQGWIATVTCSPPPNCLKPSAVTITGATQNTLTVDWTEMETANSWQVLVLPVMDPIPDETATGWQQATTKPFEYGPLDPGTQYKVYVRSVCSDGDSSHWSYPIVENTMITNDSCENAITVPVNSGSECSQTVYGTMDGATGGTSFCFGPLLQDDVWYKFTASADTHFISVTGFLGGSGLAYGLYSGSCEALTLINCSNADGILATGLTPGETYYILVAMPGDNTWFSICIGIPGPPIVVNDDYSRENLVMDILLDYPCAVVSNITSSTGIDFGSPDEGIGYFNSNGSGFPYSEGVILMTGDISGAPGPNTTIAGGGYEVWPGDPDLEDIVLEATGEAMNGFNATKLEFDFVPIANSISFNFLFVSEEYGTYQCSFSDTFAFLLTDVTAETPFVNLAVLPDTSVPVSVVTIRDAIFNGYCESMNKEYFGEYYGNVPGGSQPYGAPINFNGITVPLTAQSQVIPGHTYHFKLVIADRADTILDSAVFIEAGSFNLRAIELGPDYLLADGTAFCAGDSYLLNSGLTADDYTFIWTKDGTVQENLTSPSITITETGVYGVTATLNNSGCSAEGIVTIEFFDLIVLDSVTDISQCSPFTVPVPTVGHYYDSPSGMGNILDGSVISSMGATTVYLYSPNGPNCDAEKSFTVTISEVPTLVEIQDVMSCGTYTLPQIENVVYYNGPNATAGVITAVASTQQVYAYAAGATANCSDEESFIVTINDPLILGPIPDVVSCGDYTLPILEGVTYYSGQDATGEIITDVSITQQVYAYLAGEVTDCSAQQSFTVTINDLPELPGLDNVISCGPYTLPATPGITFYSQSAAMGAAITSVNTTQPVYAFSAGAMADCWSEVSFTVTIVEAPQLEILAGCQGNDYVLEVVVTNNDVEGYTFSWNSADGNIVSGSDSNSVVVSGDGTYSVEVTLGQQDCDGQAQTFVAGTTCMIQKGISVNGDGKNDFFDLDGFNVQKIEIFNRYGMKVYERSLYTNQWNGQSDEGHELPDGAYYYVLWFETAKQKTGWIYVNREN